MRLSVILAVGVILLAALEISLFRSRRAHASGSYESGFNLAAFTIPSSISPPKDFCMFSRESVDIVRPIYQRLENDLRKYAQLTEFQREQYVRGCRDTPDICTFVSIRDGKARVVQSAMGFEDRNSLILQHLARIVEMFEPLPDVDFAIDHGDGSRSTDYLPRFMLSTYVQAPQGIMIPDFSFIDWPTSKCRNEASRSFTVFVSNATDRWSVMKANATQYVMDKVNDIFWRGSQLENPKREKQLDAVMNSSSLPSEFLNLSFMNRAVEGDGGCISMHDHCSHRHLLHLQGNTYSSRLKYLLLCGSVVFVPQQEYEEWWYPAIASADSTTPDNEIVIHLEEDMSGFDDKVYDLIEGDLNRTISLSTRALDFALQVFSSRNVDCYWGSVIIGAARAWGTIIDGSPGKPLEEVLRNPKSVFSEL